LQTKQFSGWVALETKAGVSDVGNPAAYKKTNARLLVIKILF